MHPWEGTVKEESFPHPGNLLRSGWVLKLRLQQTDPGRGLSLAAWRQSERTAVWSRPTEWVCAGWTWVRHRNLIISMLMVGCSFGFSGLWELALTGGRVDLWADYQYSHSGDRSRGYTSSSRLWVHKPGGRRCHRVACPSDSPCGETHSGSFPSRSTPVLSTSHHSTPHPELDPGVSTPTTGEQTLPLTELWQPQSQEEALPNIQCRLQSPQHQTHPYQGDNSHTLRKTVAGIYTKNSPCTKNTGLTQFTQGCSHIKTALQGLPWWRSGWESACQCRGHGFEPWSGKIPHAVEQLGPLATITEPARLEPVLRNKRGRNSERAAIVRGPRTVMKSGPHLPQLEKDLAQKQRPYTAISK